MKTRPLVEVHLFTFKKRPNCTTLKYKLIKTYSFLWPLLFEVQLNRFLKYNCLQILVGINLDALILVVSHEKFKQSQQRCYSPEALFSCCLKKVLFAPFDVNKPALGSNIWSVSTMDIWCVSRWVGGKSTPCTWHTQENLLLIDKSVYNKCRPSGSQSKNIKFQTMH